MKIMILKRFDYRFPSGAVMCCTPHPDPVTVKREVGEHGVSIGAATEVGRKPAPKTKTAPAKAAKTASNDDIGKVGSAPTGQAGTSRPDTSTAADMDSNDDGDSATGAGLDSSG